MKTATIVAIAAALTSLAAPALAQPEGSFGKAKVTFDRKLNKYCLKEVLPSTIVPAISCRTAEDWAQAGLTISHKPAVQLARR
ncbi:MAG: hypothetical protein QHC40_11390 [Sphingobium sp.]|nr:hypothetical protein [Sphingobium sp.]